MNVSDDTSATLADSLIAAIQPLVSTFEVRAAPIVDNEGARFGVGPLVVHSRAATGLPEVPIDTVAAVIECHEVLTTDGLRKSYALIESLKLASKATAASNPKAAIDMTVGFIIARTSALNLEEIAAEVLKLNAATPSQQWPDGVAILTSGLINYTAHVPNREQGGDFFLFAKGVPKSQAPQPSLYINLMVRGMGDQTFKKVVSLVMVRVAIFEPGIDIPNYLLLLDGVPRYGLPQEKYQLNLAGRMTAMSARQQAGIRLNLGAYHIESAGKHLGSIEFVDWQDGGVLIVRGDFPILPFFICLAQVVPGIDIKDLQYFGNPGKISVSFVLPINRVHFLKILSRFEMQSGNIRIKHHSPKLLIQQVGNEGVSSPFISRLMVGVMEMRDAVHASEAERNQFDDLYEPVLSGARDAREACRQLEALWVDHKNGVKTGAILRSEGMHTTIIESIDRPLKRELDSFLTTAVRTLKNAMQNLAHDYGVDIGFLFKKEAAFRSGLARMTSSDASLAAYLEKARTWTEPLIDARNNLEHGTVQPPKVVYHIQQSPISASEPMFVGQPVTQFANDALQRLLCFAEEVTIYCLNQKMPKGLQISEIYTTDRTDDFPRRFRLSVSSGGITEWQLSGGDARFDRS